MTRILFAAILSVAAAGASGAADLPQPAPNGSAGRVCPAPAAGLQLGQCVHRYQWRVGWGNGRWSAPATVSLPGASRRGEPGLMAPSLVAPWV